MPAVCLGVWNQEKDLDGHRRSVLGACSALGCPHAVWLFSDSARALGQHVAFRKRVVCGFPASQAPPTGLRCLTPTPGVSRSGVGLPPPLHPTVGASPFISADRASSHLPGLGRVEADTRFLKRLLRGTGRDSVTTWQQSLAACPSSPPLVGHGRLLSPFSL